MRRAARIAAIAGGLPVGIAIAAAATGWLYVLGPLGDVPGPRIGEALPLDELARRGASPLAVFVVVWAAAAAALGLVARALRADRPTAALLLALGVGAWAYLTTGASIAVVRQIPPSDAFHAAASLRAIYLPAALAGLAGAIAGRTPRREVRRAPLLLAVLVGAVGVLGVLDAVLPPHGDSLLASLVPASVRPLAHALVPPLGLALLVVVAGPRAAEASRLAARARPARRAQRHPRHAPLRRGRRRDAGRRAPARRVPPRLRPAGRPDVASARLAARRGFLPRSTSMARSRSGGTGWRPTGRTGCRSRRARRPTPCRPDLRGSSHLAGAVRRVVPALGASAGARRDGGDRRRRGSRRGAIASARRRTSGSSRARSCRHGEWTRSRRSCCARTSRTSSARTSRRSWPTAWSAAWRSSRATRSARRSSSTSSSARFVAYARDARLADRDPRRVRALAGALPRARAARPLPRRRGGGRRGVVLARRPRDPQGAPVRAPARAGRLPARSAARRARSTPELRASSRRSRGEWRGDEPERGFVDGARRALPPRRRGRALRRSGTAPTARRGGFLHFAVSRCGPALSLSSMPRLRDTPNGFNEWLVCETRRLGARARLRAHLAELRAVRRAARARGRAHAGCSGSSGGRCSRSRATSSSTTCSSSTASSSRAGSGASSSTSAGATCRGSGSRRSRPRRICRSAAATGRERIASGSLLALASAVALNWGYFTQHGAASGLPPLTLRRPLRSLRLALREPPLARRLPGRASAAGCSTSPRSRSRRCRSCRPASAGGIGVLALLVGAAARLPRRERLGRALVDRRPAAARRLARRRRGRGQPGVVGCASRSGCVLGGARRAGGGPARAAARAGRRPRRRGGGPLRGRRRRDEGGGGGGARLAFVPALLACHGLAFVALQLGFQRGGALATAGVATLCTNALPIVAGTRSSARGCPAASLGVAARRRVRRSSSSGRPLAQARRGSASRRRASDRRRRPPYH